MSQGDVEVVRGWWTTWLDGEGAALSVSAGEVVYDHREDPDDLFAHLDPDVEVHPLTGAMLEDVAYRGYSGVRRWLEDVAAYWDAMWVRAERFLDAGDSVVVLGGVYGRGKKSRVPIEGPAAWVCQLRDGRLSYVRIYLDHASALRAVGLEG